MNRINQYVNEALIGNGRKISKKPVKNIDDLKKIVKEKYKENPEYIDLNSYDVSNLTDLSYVFAGCKELKEVSIEFWDVDNVTTMEAMFFECASLEKINLLGWNVQNLQTTNSMFFGCKSLKELDLHTWKCYNLTNLQYMFFKCPKLEDIKLPDYDIIDVNKIRKTDMFKGCFALSRNKKLPEWY